MAGITTVTAGGTTGADGSWPVLRCSSSSSSSWRSGKLPSLALRPSYSQSDADKNEHSCLARRRRKRGVSPYYGTGWMAPNAGKFGAGGGHNSYPMNNQQSGYYAGGGGGGATYNPPPAYGANEPQYTGTTFNPQDGYYGNQQYNSGLQSPPNAYQPDNVYPPAPAPPPGGGK